MSIPLWFPFASIAPVPTPLANSNFAYETGRTIGLVLAILAVVKCIKIMRRETTSALCVAPLLAVSLAWLISLPLHISPDFLGLRLRLWVDAAMILGLLVAVVLGFVGIGLYNRGRFTQGRKQAVWGILIGSILVLARTSAVVRVISSPEFTQTIEAERSNAVSASARTEVEFSDLNFKMTLPNGPWAKLKDPKSVNPNATVILRRAYPPALAVLIAEPVDLRTDALANLAKANLEGGFENVAIKDEKSETVNGIEWQSFSAEIPKRGVAPAEISRLWVAGYAGHSYQWIISMSLRDRESVGATGRNILSGFHLIDSTKQGSRTSSVIDAKIEEDGFKTSLGGIGWLQMTIADESMRGSSIRAMHPSASFFLADTMPLTGMDVTTEDIARAFFANYGALDAKASQIKLDKIKLSGAEDAARFSTEFEIEKQKSYYKGIIARSGERAYLFLGWRAGNETKDTGHIDAALNTVEIRPSAGPLPPPRDEEMKKKRSLLVHALGLEFSNRADWPKALKAFSLSYEISQHNDATLESIAIAMEETGDINGAVALFEKNRERVSQSGSLRLTLGRLKRQLGDTEGALAEYDAAFDKGEGKEANLLAYLTALIDGNRSEDAKKVVDEFVAKGASPKVRRWQAETYASTGDSKRAIDIYEEILAKPPYDPLAAYGLGETANSEGQYERAATAAAGLIKAGNDTARTRMIEGWSYFGRKSWREAKISFEKARAFAPNEPTIESALVRVSAMLGEGDNSSVKTPIEPVALPAQLLEAITKIGTDTPVPEGASVCYLMRANAFHFEPGKPVSSTQYRRAKVITQAGVGDFSTLAFQFDPLSERIYVNRLVVTDEKGTVTAEGLPEEQYVVDLSADAGEATHSKVLRVVVPGLKPGCTLEVVLTKQDRSPSTEFPFERCICAVTVPSLAEAVVVTGDVARIRAAPSAAMLKSAVVTDGKTTRSWLIRQPVVWKPESHLPYAESYLPVIRLGPEKTDWADVGRDYLKQIDSLLKPDAKTKSIAAEVAGKLKGDDEKIRAITSYVQKNVTYQAIEFGRRARIPKPAERVVSSRYGDCKDQALLLYQLLKAAGVPAQLALVHSDGDIETSLPSLDQFNHMIVRLPGQKAAFVDPTNTELPAGVLPPALFNRKALVLYPDKPRLEALPERSSFPSERIVSERDITVAPDGELTVRERIRMSGFFAMGWREWVSAIEPSERLAAAQRLHNDSRWRVEDFAVEGMDDNAAELVFKLSYGIPASPSPTKSDSVVIPAVWEHEYLEAQFLKERRFPMEFVHPVRIESHVKLQLPRPPGKAALEAFERSADSEFGKWKIVAKSGEANSVTVDFEFQAPSGNYPAARYADWQSFRSKVVEAWQRPLKLE